MQDPPRKHKSMEIKQLYASKVHEATTPYIHVHQHDFSNEMSPPYHTFPQQVETILSEPAIY